MVMMVIIIAPNFVPTQKNNPELNHSIPFKRYLFSGFVWIFDSFDCFLNLRHQSAAFQRVLDHAAAESS
jgi:hypothetical protein